MASTSWWLIPLLELDIQLEEVARSLDVLMRTHIEDAIDAVWDEMEEKDAEYYAAIGEPAPVTPKLYPAKFFLGHHPSILERDPEDYPNITVVSYDHRSANDFGADQYETARNLAYVEAFVLHDDESVVNRLAWRYAKAMHRVVGQFKDLSDSDIEPITATPETQISNAAARRVSQFTDDITYIQGCRLEYSFRTKGLW